MISYGQRLLAEYLSALTGMAAEMDVHPVWLDGMEIDLFYPQWDLALEFQGQHHYMPIGGEKALRRQQSSDRRKLELCEQNGVLLIRFDLVDLRHPEAIRVIMRRFVSCYGQQPGMARFFKICGENPISRTSLFDFNRRFDTHRINQLANHGPAMQPGNPKQRRRLRRAMHRRLV